MLNKTSTKDMVSRDPKSGRKFSLLAGIFEFCRDFDVNRLYQLGYLKIVRHTHFQVIPFWDIALVQKHNEIFKIACQNLNSCPDFGSLETISLVHLFPNTKFVWAGKRSKYSDYTGGKGRAYLLPFYSCKVSWIQRLLVLQYDKV